MTEKGAVFSPCGKYRPLIWRRWDDLFTPTAPRWLLFAGANPSIANAERSDATISQMVGRAKRIGCTGFLGVNANAYVSTDPKGLIGVADPCGPENNDYILAAAELAEIIVLAWGALPGAPRSAELLAMLMEHGHGHKLHALGRTAGGFPRIPAASTRRHSRDSVRALDYSKMLIVCGKVVGKTDADSIL